MRWRDLFLGYGEEDVRCQFMLFENLHPRKRDLLCLVDRKRRSRLGYILVSPCSALCKSAYCPCICALGAICLSLTPVCPRIAEVSHLSIDRVRLRMSLSRLDQHL